ncbi:Na(+)/H(+) antiporter NhaG [Lentibacillus sp. JNUCC-1]|uniref:cation:proton antiporter n=1 Tax=Lentibacillus sp. JNUCC-1 TaxID=2654513 RepID=UPI0012E80A69|nr:sodium:proton antiporter [Lentibacillus sp. JNUCC-1]MUV38903.1 Na(+)/H(+) antiporter NhaG [Lentibacillus sp. JNUCC-1]
MTPVKIVILLAIGYIVFTIDKKQKNFPVPVVLVVIGILLSFIPFFSDIQVTENMIYKIFLPGLLFAAAYQYPAQALKRNAGVIATLSTIGLALTAGLLGVIIYAIGGPYAGISLIGALVVASILTPTDPVSVVAILKQSTDDPSIGDVVDGESMINDGTSVVLFGVLSGMYLNQEAFQPLGFLKEFLYVSAGGVLLGVVIGWGLSKLIYITHHRDYQVMLSLVIAYGGFYLSEHFGFSGVLTTVFAGIMLSFELSRSSKETSYRSSLGGFWEVAEPSLLSLLFLLIGIEAADYLAFSFNGWMLAVIVFIASLIVRFVIVTLTMQVFDGWRHIVKFKYAALISWGGIKGTMSVFLLLSLSTKSSGGADFLLSLSFAVIMLSLIVQSLGVSPLSKLLADGRKSS